MPKKKSLLIVEDERPILEGLVDLFVFHGYDVDAQSDGLLGLEAAQNNRYDCIILDVMLPSMDGFSICNAIRKQSREQPIVMLTAKTSEEDIVNGLSMGADDYISKPFSVRELVLRVGAILRRNGIDQENADISITSDIEINPISLQGSVKGETILFTRREIEILQYLKQQYNIPVSRNELLSKVWGYKKCDDIDTRTVDIHIAKLRKKIELDPKKPSIIVTMRGEGYLLQQRK